MTLMDIREAAIRLNELIARMRAGEEVIIAEDGTPVARLMPAESASGSRRFGEFAGKLQMSDDFAHPLSDEELAEMGL